MAPLFRSLSSISLQRVIISTVVCSPVYLFLSHPISSASSFLLDSTLLPHSGSDQTAAQARLLKSSAWPFEGRMNHFVITDVSRFEEEVWATYHKSPAHWPPKCPLHSGRQHVTCRLVLSAIKSYLLYYSY